MVILTAPRYHVSYCLRERKKGNKNHEGLGPAPESSLVKATAIFKRVGFVSGSRNIEWMELVKCGALESSFLLHLNKFMTSSNALHEIELSNDDDLSEAGVIQ